MTQYHGSPGLHVINVLIVVSIPDVSAVCFSDKTGCAAYRFKGTDRGVYATGNRFLRAGKEDFRF